MSDEPEPGTTFSAPNPYLVWVQAVQNLDANAWDDLLKFYAGELRRDIEVSLRKRDLPVNLAEDIEQETWITAIQKIKDFHWESDEKFYHWLRVISLNHIRAYGRIQQNGMVLDDFRNSLSDIGSPDDLIETWLV